MKLVKVEVLIDRGPFASSREWRVCRQQIEKAISAVVWPPGARSFTIHDNVGRGRGEGNGVVPIKSAFLASLQKSGWDVEDRANPYRFDAFLHTGTGAGVGLEWETGNVSSSHRSLNRILLAHHRKELLAGALVLPTRKLYRYLTDRIGNYEEVEDYFPVWRSYRWDEGVLAIFAVEHDKASASVPRISKGTDGRALL
jgi:hypothetical protein